MYQDDKNNDDEFQFSDADEYEMDSGETPTDELGNADDAHSEEESVGDIFSSAGGSGDSVAFTPNEPNFLQRYWRILVALGAALILILIVVVVLNGGNKGDASKPAGQNITSNMAALTNEVSSLQNQVVTLKASISSVTTTLGEVKAAVDSKQDMSQIQSQLDSLSKEVTSLRSQPKTIGKHHVASQYTVESCAGNLAWIQCHSQCPPNEDGLMYAVRAGDVINNFGTVEKIVENSGKNNDQRTCEVILKNSKGDEFPISLGSRTIG